jgi:hypothetical protein
MEIPLAEDRIVKSIDLNEELKALPKQAAYSTGYGGLEFGRVICTSSPG